MSSGDYIFWGLSEVCGAGVGGAESHAGGVVQVHQVRGKTAPVVGERAVRFADAHAYGASVDHPHAKDGVADRVNNAFVARCRDVLLIDEFAFGALAKKSSSSGLMKTS